MPAKNQTLANALLDAVLGNVAYSSPAAVYAALFTVAPTATTPGTEVVTAGGTLYNRVAITFGGAALGQDTNSAPIAFPTAGANWGTAVSVGIMDNATPGLGNLLYFGDLTVHKAINTGDQATFAALALAVTEL